MMLPESGSTSLDSAFLLDPRLVVAILLYFLRKLNRLLYTTVVLKRGYQNTCMGIYTGCSARVKLSRSLPITGGDARSVPIG